MGKAYWRTAAIGDLIPPLVKSSVSRVQFVKFAAATKDYNPLHLDDDFARMQGYGGVFAQGNLVLSFIEEALHNFAENGRLIRLLGTFHKMVWPGDLLTSKALISDRYKHNGEPRIDFEVWIENQYHDIVVKGQATYILWESQKEEAAHHDGIPSLSEASIEDAYQTIRSKLAHLNWKQPLEDGIPAPETPGHAHPSETKGKAASKRPSSRPKKA